MGEAGELGGRTSDLLDLTRRTLVHGADLLSDEQRRRVEALFAADDHTDHQPPHGRFERAKPDLRPPGEPRKASR